MFYHSQFFSMGMKKYLDNDSEYYYLRLAQSRTCLWVSADPRCGEEIGTVPGLNRSSRYPGHPEMRGHLEATTVRAFLVSAGFPTAGVTEEAHLHCRTCGRVFPSEPRQTSTVDAFGRHPKKPRIAPSFGSGVSTGWFQSDGASPFRRLDTACRQSGPGFSRTVAPSGSSAAPACTPGKGPDP